MDNSCSVGRLFCALEVAFDIADWAPIPAEDIRPAGGQAALSGEAPICVDRGAIDLRRHVTISLR